MSVGEFLNNEAYDNNGRFIWAQVVCVPKTNKLVVIVD